MKNLALLESPPKYGLDAYGSDVIYSFIPAIKSFFTLAVKGWPPSLVALGH